jgi:hypothetical protein
MIIRTKHHDYVEGSASAAFSELNEDYILDYCYALLGVILRDNNLKLVPANAQTVEPVETITADDGDEWDRFICEANDIDYTRLKAERDARRSGTEELPR